MNMESNRIIRVRMPMGKLLAAFASLALLSSVSAPLSALAHDCSFVPLPNAPGLTELIPTGIGGSDVVGSYSPGSDLSRSFGFVYNGSVDTPAGPNGLGGAVGMNGNHLGTAPGELSVLSFRIAGVRPDEIGKALTTEGIVTRVDRHNVQPMLRRQGFTSTARVSPGIDNTVGEMQKPTALLRQFRH